MSFLRRWLSRREAVAPDEAVIVTEGEGTRRVYFDSAPVLPFIDRPERVDMRVKMLPIELMGKDGPATRDDYRLDLRVVFYCRIPPREEAVLAATRHFGVAGVGDVEALRALASPKLAALVRRAVAELDADVALRDHLRLSDLMLELGDDDYFGYEVTDIVIEIARERQSVD